MDYDLNDLVAKQFEIDRFYSEDRVLSRDDKRALDQLAKSIRLVDGKIEASCLWKVGEPSYPNNYSYARNRLFSTEASKRYNREGVREKFNSQIEDWEQKGYVRKVPPEEQKPLIAFYLPIFPVCRWDKPTTKVRVVVDAKAKFNNKSLNDGILAGPKFGNDVLPVLNRMRAKPIAIGCDIKEMFLQIGLAEPDRKFHRFLHRKSPGDRIQEYEFLVHSFGNTGSPTVANFTIQSHAKKYQDVFPRAVETITKSTLVDDSLDSFDTAEEAIAVAQQMIEIYGSIGMNLTKFCSNSPEFIATIPSEVRAQGFELLGPSTESEFPNLKVLGVKWDPVKDILTFDSTEPQFREYTKRQVIKEYSSLYDPIGFSLPYVIQARIIFTMCWDLKLDWDQKIPENIAKLWSEWLKGLRHLHKFKIKRCLIPEPQETTDLKAVIFCDASSDSYGAVAYIWTCTKSEKTHTRLCMARCNLSPRHKLTIPRLELQAAVLGAQVGHIIANSIGISKKDIRYFTDSQNVLWWIKNPSRTLREFVANRVEKIDNLSLIENWNHVKGEENPADVLSRGCSAEMLADHELWWNGPAFLRNRDWLNAKDDCVIQPSPEAELELKKPKILVTMVDNPFVNFLRYDSWYKLIRLWARVWKIVRFFQDKKLRDLNYAVLWRVSPKEFQDSELFLVGQMQRQAYAQTIKTLQSSGTIHKTDELVQLQPVLYDGILRANARFGSHKKLPYSKKHPIILPKNHPGTQLIIRHYHVEELAHIGGIDRVLSAMNSKYWIVRGKTQINKVLKSCVHCKKCKRRPMEQIQAPIPDYRVPIERVRAFEKVALDVAGHFDIKQGRSIVKRYALIISDLTYRGLHNEDLTKLDTASFIQALERFSARRGKPSYIRCDNGTNFKSGKRELEELLGNLNKDILYEKYPMITWDFAKPMAPHTNGIIERIVGLVKNGMKAIITTGLLTEEEFRTVLTRVEGLINGRPLTYVGSHPGDLKPITPSDFYAGTTDINLIPVFHDEESDPHFSYRERHKHVHHVLDRFWQRFVQEYVPTLNQFTTKWTHASPEIKVGDVVMLLEKSEAGRYPLALVEKTLPNPQDGKVRNVVLTLAKPQSGKDLKLRTGHRHLTRNIRYLVMISPKEEPERNS